MQEQKRLWTKGAAAVDSLLKEKKGPRQSPNKLAQVNLKPAMLKTGT